MDDSKDTVVEGELFEDTSPTPPPAMEVTVDVEEAQAPSGESSDAELMINLGNLINSNLTEIDKIEGDLANQKEMLDSVLENDATYKDHAERAKEASRIKSATKKEIFKRPDVSHVVVKLNELKDDIKNTKEELSQYVQEYARVSGQNYFEAADGSIQEIVYVAKLRKKQA